LTVQVNDGSKVSQRAFDDDWGDESFPASDAPQNW
jgi:hypothetical protein